MSPKEVATLDPQQRITLEVTYEALQNSGKTIESLKGSNTAVFIGAASTDHAMSRSEDATLLNPYSMTGSNLSIISNRLSYFFDWHGPSMTIDTACSSSLVALHQACSCLATGSASMAVAGGVNIFLSPIPFVGFSQAHMLSKDGLCKVFSEDANGYVRSEGGAVVILKPLEQAKKDHDNILGVIVSTAVNSDGKTSGIALPNGEAQAKLLEHIYSDSNINLKDFVYIEAHGTGTLVGDPIETKSIGTVLGKKVHELTGESLPIGSIKANIGHLETASGMAGLLKSLLVLQHHKIPATPIYGNLNPKINFNELKLKVASEELALRPTQGEPLVGVNSFGFGGTNAHVVLQGYDDSKETCNDTCNDAKNESCDAKKDSQKSGLLPFRLKLSAKTKESLNAYVAASLEQIKSYQEDKDKVLEFCASISAYRDDFSEKFIAIAQTINDLKTALQNFVKLEKSGSLTDASGNIQAIWQIGSGKQQQKTSFVFSGNGCQYLGFGTKLYQENSTFKKTFDKIDAILQKYQTWSLVDALFNKEDQYSLSDTLYAQPLLFAYQVALSEVLLELGISADAACGHSVGEVAAAYFTGALTLEDATLIIAKRSSCQAKTRNLGRMCVVRLNKGLLVDLLTRTEFTNVNIAAFNTDDSFTLSGPENELKDLGIEVSKLHGAFKFLDLDYAFHSKYMEVVHDEIISSLNVVAPKKEGNKSFYSTVTGNKIAFAKLTADYWWQNVRESVQFAGAIKSQINAGIESFIEIGPNPILNSYIKQISKNLEVDTYVSYLQKIKLESNENLFKNILNVLSSGYPVDATSFYFENYANRKLELPTYEWHKTKNWLEPSTEGYHVFNRQMDGLVLGYVDNKSPQTWNNVVDKINHPELAGHIVKKQTIMPAATFVEVAMNAALKSLPKIAENGAVELLNFGIERSLSLEDSVSLKTTTDNFGKVQISAHEYTGTADYISYAVGRFMRATPDLSASLGSVDEVVLNEFISKFKKYKQTANLSSDLIVTSGDEIYKRASLLGIDYQDNFKVIDNVVLNSESTIGVVSFKDTLDFYDEHFKDSAIKTLDVKREKLKLIWRPETIDAVLQAVFAFNLFNLENTPKLYLPSFFGKIHLNKVDNEECIKPSYALIHLERCLPHSICIAFTLFDSKDNVILKVTDCRYREMPIKLENKLAVYHEELEVAPSLDSVSVLKQTLSLKDTYDSTPLFNQNLAAYIESHEDFNALVEAYICACILELKPVVGESTSAEVIFNFIVDEAQIYFEHYLLNLLVDNDLASREDDDCYTIFSDEFASSSDIFSEIVANYPSDIAILSKLLKLGSSLQDILTGSLAVQDVFKLKNNQNPIVSDLQGAEISKILIQSYIKDCANTLNNNEVLRVLEIANPELGNVADLLESNLNSGNVHVTIATSSNDELLLLKNKYFNKNIDIKLIDELKTKFDIVIDKAEFYKETQLSNYLKEYNKFLALGGKVIGFEPNNLVLNDFIAGATQQHWLLSTNEQEPISAFFNNEILSNTLQKVDFSLESSFEVIDSLVFLMSSACENTTDVNTLDDSELHKFSLVNFVDSENALINEVLGLNAITLPLVNSENVTFDSENKAVLQGNTNLIIDFSKVVDLVTATATLTALLNLSEELKVKNIVVITNDPNTNVANALVGLMRVAFNEITAIKLKTISLKDFERDTLNSLKLELQYGELDEVILDKQVRFNPTVIELPGKILSSDKLQQHGLTNTTSSNVSQETQVDLCSSKINIFKLESKSGRIGDLSWNQDYLELPKDDELCIEVKATGLNFRDVLYAQGLLPDEALESGFSGPSLGLECSGVVVKVGANVKNFKVGDEVISLAPQCFASHVIAPEIATVHKPENMSFAEAASIAVAYFTAYYAIVYKANAEPGESILIHGGAGGVGLAAIEIAQNLGLEVYATVGNPFKRKLLESMGVKHIYNSRDLSFGDKIPPVDIVLNSLFGDGALKSLALLKPFGRFLELGKRDFYADNPLFLRAFRDNLSYFGIDVDELLTFKPKLAGEIFSKLMDKFKNDEYHVRPLNVYQWQYASKAFLDMRASVHIGKIVVDVSTLNIQNNVKVDKEQALILSKDTNILITGGMGGLGFALAKRFVNLGFANLTLIGRKEANNASVISKLQVLQELANDNGVINYLSLDLTDNEKVQQSIANLVDSNKSAKFALVHCAAVLDDGLIKDLNYNRFNKVITAKVASLENLLASFDAKDVTLEREIFFSSVTTIFGNPGQANYVSANMALEALAQRRRAQSKNATVFAWGPVSDVGMLENNAKVLQIIEKTLGTSGITSEEVVNAILSLGNSPLNMHVFKVNWEQASSVRSFKAHRFNNIRNKYKVQVGLGKQNLAEEVRAQKDPTQALQIISNFLKGQISTLMEINVESIPVNKKIAELGMDSLMLMELGSSIEESLEIKIPSSAFSNTLSINMLAEKCFSLISDDDAIGNDVATDIEIIKQKHGIK